MADHSHRHYQWVNRQFTPIAFDELMLSRKPPETRTDPLSQAVRGPADEVLPAPVDLRRFLPRESAIMKVLHSDDVPREDLRPGMTYQTLVGDALGSTPITVGIQTSMPGYRTLFHSHPYLEVITVLDGNGEAWVEGTKELIQMRPGITLEIPANQKHWFGAVGNKPLITYGIHASPRRIVIAHDEPA